VITEGQVVLERYFYPDKNFSAKEKDLGNFRITVLV
jgi:hypothetical protein